jgi:hypothetical protein
MIVETQIIPFSQWFIPALSIFGAVVGILLLIIAFAGVVSGTIRNGPRRAFVNIFKTIGSTFRDIFTMSPRRIRALAWLAVKDSIRRKIVVVFAVFIILLSFAGWFLDPGNDHPLRLYITFVMSATNFLVLLLVLFLSVFSLPTDLKNKTLHTVVTKPVRPSEVVMGRIIGFSAIGTFFLVAMGLVCYLFVTRGLNHTHQVDVSSLQAVADAAPNDQGLFPMRGRSTFNSRHRHTLEVNASGKGSLEVNKDHWHPMVRLKGDGKKVEDYAVGKPEGMLVARVPVYGKLRFYDRERIEKKKGVNVGDEWAYRSYIQGGSLASAVWTFDNIRPEEFPKNIEVEMTLGVFRTYKGDIVSAIPGNLYIRNPKTGLTVERPIFLAKEFVTDVQRIPRIIDDPDNVFYLDEKETGDNQSKTVVRRQAPPELANKAQFDLFKDLSYDGSFEIWLQCLDQDQYFGVAQADLYLRAKDAPFYLNFLKGYFGLWMQMVLVVCIGIMFSTFLSGPVAGIVTMGFLVMGLFRSFVIDLGTGNTWGGGPVESFIRILTQQNVVSDMEESFRTTVAKTADGILMFLLKAVSHILPDLRQFGASDYVAYGFNIPGDWIAERGLTTLAFAVVLFLLGYFFMKTREVAKQ